MKALKIHFEPRNNDDELYGQSKWWGPADFPDSLEYPLIKFEDGDTNPMTMICQIRCADLAPVDPENLLPHTGMLYFFADIDEYVGALNQDEEEDVSEEDDDDGYFINDDGFPEKDVICDYCGNSMGEWDNDSFRVVYSPTEDDLVERNIMNDDDTPYTLPAEKLTFEVDDNPAELDFHLLGKPFETEVQQEYPGYINLLQVWEEERWGLTMFDCGIINFLIKPEDLKARRFDRVVLYLHSC